MKVLSLFFVLQLLSLNEGANGCCSDKVAEINNKLEEILSVMEKIPICSKVYANCSELLLAGYTRDGVYEIDPDGQGSFPVFCDMTTDGGGWTVFQRNRKNSLVSFNQSWKEYQAGFGNLSGEFWLGFDQIERLTKANVTSLRVDLEDFDGTKTHAVYSSFSIADESDFYRLHVSGYSGNAEDSLEFGPHPISVTTTRGLAHLTRITMDGSVEAVHLKSTLVGGSVHSAQFQT